MPTNHKYHKTGTKHHCIGASEGNCRQSDELGYCLEHEQACPKHPSQYFGLFQSCRVCKLERERDAKKAARKVQLAKEKAQAEKDNAFFDDTKPDRKPRHNPHNQKDARNPLAPGNQ